MVAKGELLFTDTTRTPSRKYKGYTEDAMPAQFSVATHNQSRSFQMPTLFKVILAYHLEISLRSAILSRGSAYFDLIFGK